MKRDQSWNYQKKSRLKEKESCTAIAGAGEHTGQLTVNILSEGILPAVHLDELYAHQDLVHQPDTPVGDCHALLAEIRRQSGCEHLAGTKGSDDKSGRKEMKAGTMTLSALQGCLGVGGRQAPVQSDRCTLHRHQDLWLSRPRVLRTTRTKLTAY